MSRNVRIFEVGPRDGLQNEPVRVALATKLAFIRGLVRSGLHDIEIGSFVRPDRIPQMRDSDQLYRRLSVPARVRLWSLVPNLLGLERARTAGAKAIAVFTAASDTFNINNTGMTIEKSLQQLVPVVAQAKDEGLQVRGYVSTVFGCPFEGRVPIKRVVRIVAALCKMGVHEVSLGDTIGVATPGDVDKILQSLISVVERGKLAVHFHDTRGTALANVVASLEQGIRCIDASAGGLGGCPYAPGATGNLATEDLVYMLNGMGLKTGVTLDVLAETSIQLAKKMRRPIVSRYVHAYLAQKRRTNRVRRQNVQNF